MKLPVIPVSETRASQPAISEVLMERLCLRELGRIVNEDSSPTLALHTYMHTPTCRHVPPTHTHVHVAHMNT